MRYESPSKAIACEFAGTFALVTASAAAVIYSHLLFQSDPLFGHLMAAAVGAAVVSSCILLFGDVSGAYLNPGVTNSQAMVGYMPARLLAPYWVAQIMAAVVSGIFLRFAFGSLGMPTEFGLPKLEGDTSVLAGITLEAIGSFGRSMTSLFSSSHLEEKPKTAATLVGGALFIMTIIISPFTGASFNPAVSLGPAIASGDYSYTYIYIIAATVGSIAATIPYRLRRR